MKATAYIATSVDGFIARENGGLDWLPQGDKSEDGEDYGYREFMDSVDAMVMGRNTHELVLSFGSWPYEDKPVFILSSRQLDIPVNIPRIVESISASPQEVIQRLQERGFKHLYIDGGKTIQGFLNEGLLQRLIITKIPILLGTGIPLFGPLLHDVKLAHIKTQQFKSGFVQSEYKVL